MASQPTADRLGLALAGGGFRATLFHIGVLRRLAELDLLRRIEVLSTVSGGSIAGAVYILRLKKWLEEHGRLSPEQYVDLVREVDDILCAGIRQNLRTRILLNPLVTLRVLLSQHSMGRAMARLYERYILAPALDGIRNLKPVSRRPYEVERGAVLLGDLCIRPRDADLSSGIDAYNRKQLDEGGSVITRLVLNATTLNSGGRFQFSAVEIGDYYLGTFRHDEVKDLLERKRLLREQGDGIDEVIGGRRPAGLTTTPDPRRTAALARWWRDRQAGKNPEPPAGWNELFGFMAGGRFPGDLPDANLGSLRRAKLPAWYLRYGRTQHTGGRTPEEHWRYLCTALSDMDPDLAGHVRDRLGADGPMRVLFLEYLVELYLVRTADRISPDFPDDWKRLTLGDAVGASACFPPVFPPFTLLGLYDDAFASRLGLTDGGVYDNAGITALLDEGCTSIIASDTGAPFQHLAAAPRGHVTMNLRIPSILTRALGGYQRLALRERKRISRDIDGAVCLLPDDPACAAARAALLQAHGGRDINELAYFQMDSVPPEPKGPGGLSPGFDGRKLSLLRTDLDGFGEVERTLLINHGYDTADRFVRAYMADPAGQGWAGRSPTAPRPTIGGARVERIVRAGASRVGRGLLVRAPLTVAVVAALGIAILVGALLGASPAAMWAWTRSLFAGGVPAVASVAGVLPDAVVRFLGRVFTFGPAVLGPWLAERLNDPLTVPVGFALVLALVLARRLSRSGGGATAYALSPFRTAAKWLGSYVGNVLWLVWALPLYLVGGASLFAILSWGLFYRPWERAVRVRPGDRLQPENAAPARRDPGDG